MRKKLLSILITLSLILSVSTNILAEQNDTAALLVSTALTSKTFADYNKAYTEVLNLTDETEKNELLSKLTTIIDTVYTDDVKHILKYMGYVVDWNSGRYYDKILFRINNSNLSSVDKNYFIGELVKWGKQLVWTDDYKAALEALSIAWTKKDDSSINYAAEKISSIQNMYNRTYLLECFDNLSMSIAGDKIPVSDEEKVAADYLKSKGYEITSRMGKIDDYVLQNSFYYIERWGLQSVDPDIYFGKEITEYKFTVKNHPLEKEYDELTHVFVMICDGKAFGGYSLPDEEGFDYYFSVDGKTMEQMSAENADYIKKWKGKYGY